MSEQSITISREFAEDILDQLRELKGERHWWKDEPRCGHHKAYNELCEEIERLEKLLKP